MKAHSLPYYIQKEKQCFLQLFLIVFFNKSQDAVEKHGNDAKDHNGHENPGKLETVTAHSDRKKVQKRSGSRRNYVAVWKGKHKTI